LVIGIRNDGELDEVWIIQQGSLIQKCTSRSALPVSLVLHSELLELIHKAEDARAVAEAELPINDKATLPLLKIIGDKRLDRLTEGLIVNFF
jgi:hypothetical protein